MAAVLCSLAPRQASTAQSISLMGLTHDEGFSHSDCGPQSVSNRGPLGSASHLHLLAPHQPFF